MYNYDGGVIKTKRGELFYIKKFGETNNGNVQNPGRPAIIVSNNKNNEYSSTVEIVYLTLQAKRDLPTHVKLTSGKCSNSTVLCEQIHTIDVSQLGEYIERLPDDIMDKIDEALAISIGIYNILAPQDTETEKYKKVIEEHRLTISKLEEHLANTDDKFDNKNKEVKKLKEELEEKDVQIQTLYAQLSKIDKPINDNKSLTNLTLSDLVEEVGPNEAEDMYSLQNAEIKAELATYKKLYYHLLDKVFKHNN